VGFHADPSEIKIPGKLINLLYDVELIIAGFFVKDSLAEHKHAPHRLFFTATLANLMALYEVSASSVEMIKSSFIFIPVC
jgi:hypothetical protein